MSDVMTAGIAPATDFAERSERVGASDPAAVATLRERGLRAFEACGIPTVKEEQWRKTNVEALAKTAFSSPSIERAREWLDTTDGGLAVFPELGAVGTHRLFVVDGVAVGPLPRDLPEGIRIDAWDVAGREGGPAFEQLAPELGSVASEDARAFSALNAALTGAIVAIDVAPAVAFDGTLHIVHVTTGADAPTMAHPRIVARVGRGASVTIVETHVAADAAAESVYWSNPVSEFDVGEDASLRHDRVQRDSEHAWHIGRVAYRQRRSSRVFSFNAAFGSKLARVELEAELAGDGAECRMDGFYFVDGDRLVDHHTRLDHAAPHCSSHELFKGILTDRARAVFNGRIVVRQDAQKTDAKQSNPNLLLSDEALIHTRPQLEIYADDVRCTHGATVGQIDEEQVFYLRSRGIGKERAIDLLIHAFASDVLSRAGDRRLEAALEAEMDRKLSTTRIRGEVASEA